MHYYIPLLISTVCNDSVSHPDHRQNFEIGTILHEREHLYTPSYVHENSQRFFTSHFISYNQGEISTCLANYDGFIYELSASIDLPGFDQDSTEKDIKGLHDIEIYVSNHFRSFVKTPEDQIFLNMRYA